MATSFVLTRRKAWFAIVASFAAYGFFGPGLKNQIQGFPFDWKYALGAAISSMALGICIATCLVVGVIVCIQVREDYDVERGQAIQTLAASSIASTVLPTLILICSRLFHSDGAWLILSEALLTATISLLSFLTFAGFVLSVRKN
jgi:hypothetical protein